jgi:SAM-dependent methyltransferase
MHPPVREYVRTRLPDLEPGALVVEFGSRDVNGNVRDLLPAGVTYVGVDAIDGPNVDHVGDAAEWADPADLILCLEVLEHAEDVVALVASIVRNLKPGGTAIVTCATDGRAPHSGIDGGHVRPGEVYRNVPLAELEELVEQFGGRLIELEVDLHAGDLRAVIVRA